MQNEYENNDMADTDNRPSGREVKASLQQLLASAEELLRTTASYSGAEIEAARGRLKQQMEVAQEQMGSYGEVMKDRYHELCEKTEECVRSHPWKALGAAALIGLIIGKVMSSKDNHRY